MMERIVDMECPKCKGTYESTSRDTLSVMVNHSILSICPQCTREVADLMGYTVEEVAELLTQQKEAETERNRLHYIETGVACFKCHKIFEWEEARVKNDDCSNTKAWHVNCYDNA